MENAQKSFDNIVRIIPSDIQAEKALIGKLLVDQELVRWGNGIIKTWIFLWAGTSNNF